MNKIYEIAKDLVDLETQREKIDWVLYTTGYDFGIENANKQISEFKKDKSRYRHICSYLANNSHPEDNRRAEILKNIFEPYHLSEDLNELNLEIENTINKLSKIINSFRYTLSNRPVTSIDIKQILANDPDRERRKLAFLAKCQINKPLVDGGFIELIELRKEYASLYGSNDFVEHCLKKEELDSSLFDNWIPYIKNKLSSCQNTLINYARKYINDDKIMPWDEKYIQSSIAPLLNEHVDMSDYYNVLQSFFNKFDINISNYNITYDIHPRANKSEWGYNFPIKTGEDSRILANVKNMFFEYKTLLHETGHAIHSFLLDPNDPALNKGINGIVTEGFANLFGSFLYNRLFYEDILGDSVVNQFSEFEKYNKLWKLTKTTNIFFEHNLYTNNIGSIDDIHSIYRTTYSSIIGIDPYAEELPWGSTIHYTSHPIYLHNYIMGDVTCEMLKAVFKKQKNIDNINNNQLDFFKFVLKSLIKPSGLYKFQDHFKRISGNKFTLQYLLET